MSLSVRLTREIVRVMMELHQAEPVIRSWRLHRLKRYTLALCSIQIEQNEAAAEAAEAARRS